MPENDLNALELELARLARARLQALTVLQRADLHFRSLSNAILAACGSGSLRSSIRERGFSGDPHHIAVFVFELHIMLGIDTICQ